MHNALCLACICMMPLIHAGMAVTQQGLGRSRSAAQTMVATLCAMATAAIAFTLVGAHWAGWPGENAHLFRIGGLTVSWLGAQPLSSWLGMPGSSPRALALCLEMFAAGLVAIIPVGAGSDRWRMIAVCASTVPLTAFVLPLYMHELWGGGWLAQGLHATDVSGSGVLQCVGGLAALSVAWILGPRTGKYADAQPNAIPAHNITQVMLGCLLVLTGWIAMDVACGTLFYAGSDERLALIPLNAMLSASAGLLAAVLYTRLRYRKPDASISANGWLAGLVAQSAGCLYVSPGAAVFIGLVAGALVPYLIEVIELDLIIDDPAGAIPIHLGAGLWGLVASAALTSGGLPASARWLATLVMIATLLGLVFPLLHITNLLLNRILPFRVDRDGDWHGMDVRELGSGAYPEFVLHADETVPR